MSKGEVVPVLRGSSYWVGQLIKVTPTGIMTLMVGSEEVTFNPDGVERGEGARELGDPSSEHMRLAKISAARVMISRPLRDDDFVKIYEALA